MTVASYCDKIHDKYKIYITMYCIIPTKAYIFVL